MVLPTTCTCSKHLFLEKLSIHHSIIGYWKCFIGSQWVWTNLWQNKSLFSSSKYNKAITLTHGSWNAAHETNVWEKAYLMAHWGWLRKLFFASEIKGNFYQRCYLLVCPIMGYCEGWDQKKKILRKVSVWHRP